MASSLLFGTANKCCGEQVLPAIEPMNAFQANLNHVQTEAHPFCMVCSQLNPSGLALKFTTNDDGSVGASFLGHPALEGFQGVLHGGVIALLLDGAMTNCMFARGCVAMTAELNVRYRAPVAIGDEMFIRAWVIQTVSRLHVLRAELKQNGCVKAVAAAKFMERHE
jgi:acyl-coenzyme A thioesterase PaaI-like protein